jgi:hypothetical protein
MLISARTLYYNTGLSKAGVAQQAEQLICNQQVAGSSPITSSGGEVPERPKGADCKSVVSDFGGSNPPLSTIYTGCSSGASLRCFALVVSSLLDMFSCRACLTCLSDRVIGHVRFAAFD